MISSTNTLLLSLWCIVVVCSGHFHHHRKDRVRLNSTIYEWNWSCQTSASCQYAHWLESTNQTSVCEGEGQTQKIWCPIDPVKVAQEKCLEYSQLKYIDTNELEFVHYQFRFKVERAMEREFPHMALIGATALGDPMSEIDWICSGSLISSQYVLSAAHCNAESEPKWVVLGEIKKPNDDVRNSTDHYNDMYRRIVDRINHPEFKLPKLDNDITLFKLDRPVVFGSTIRPVCLALPPHMKFIPWPAMATGWGAMGPGLKKSEDLLKVPQSLFPVSQCVKAYANETTLLSNGFDAEKMICARYESVVQNKRSPCNGDGGGPLQFIVTSHGGTWFQNGIISFGSPNCGENNNEPSAIYTNVQTYLPWIQEIVWPA